MSNLWKYSIGIWLVVTLVVGAWMYVLVTEYRDCHGDCRKDNACFDRCVNRNYCPHATSAVN